MTMRGAAIAVALAAASAALSGQTIRTRVDLVRVDALVTRSGVPIANLRASDFELRDNGVLQTIDRVSLETLPLSVTLTLDTSASVSGRKRDRLISAAATAVDNLRPPDRATLITFSHHVLERAVPALDAGAVRRLLEARQPYGGTSLYDAVYAALVSADAHDARPLVLVFSDGEDTASWLAPAAALRTARHADAVVYGVVVPDHFGPPLIAHGDPRPIYTREQTTFLEETASITGGRVVRVDAVDNLPKMFAAILREFRTRYLITYYPRGVDTPGWHAIEVKLTRLRGDVRARRGYARAGSD